MNTLEQQLACQRLASYDALAVALSLPTVGVFGGGGGRVGPPRPRAPSPPPTPSSAPRDPAKDSGQAVTGVGEAVGENINSPSIASTATVSPAAKRPSSSASASGSTSRFWITRFSGRAP
jgi:hypothetical protein